MPETSKLFELGEFLLPSLIRPAPIQLSIVNEYINELPHHFDNDYKLLPRHINTSATQIHRENVATAGLTVRFFYDKSIHKLHILIGGRLQGD